MLTVDLPEPRLRLIMLHVVCPLPADVTKSKSHSNTCVFVFARETLFFFAEFMSAFPPLSTSSASLSLLSDKQSQNGVGGSCREQTDQKTHRQRGKVGSSLIRQCYTAYLIMMMHLTAIFFFFFLHNLFSHSVNQ